MEDVWLTYPNSRVREVIFWKRARDGVCRVQRAGVEKERSLFGTVAVVEGNKSYGRGKPVRSESVGGGGG